jgi:hypothetical protein
MNDLTEKLEILNAEANSGRGVSCVKDIIMYLKRGDTNSAKAVYRNEGDKIRCYPEIQRVIENSFGCRTHFVVDCKQRFCNI